MSVSSTTVEAALAPRRRGLRPIAGLRAVVRRPSGAFGVAIVGSLLFLTAFASLVAPYGAATQNIPAALHGPSLQHLLGTDYLGRDILSRLIFGTRIELSVAVPAVAIAASCGLILGTVAGYFGGLVDNVLVVVMDALQAFPAVILALALLFLLGSSESNVMIVIGVAFTPGYARVSRALVYTTKQNQFIEAERALGASHRRIVVVHLVPNIIAPLLILMAMDIPSAIVVEAGLSFLGLGVQPPTPSWGVILSDGFQYVYNSPWAIIWASVVLMITTLGFTTLGEALRDVFDPRVAGIRSWRRP